MASRSRRRFAPTIALAGAVLVAGGVAYWSRRQVPDAVRDERRSKLFPAIRRDRIERIEVTQGTAHFALYKDHGHWQIDDGHGARRAADDAEVDRRLTETEFAEPVRRLGALDAAARTRFGLAPPRASVTLREGSGGASLSFAIGGLVSDEPDVYVETGGQGYVAPRSLGDLFVEPASALRDRSLSDLEPSRVARIELDGEGGHRVLERADPVWRLTDPPEGRVARGRLESLLNDLRDMHATRFLGDDADAATLAHDGLSPPRLTVRATRDRSGGTMSWRFGGACDGRDDEVTVIRGDGASVACTGRAIVDNLARTADELRDDHLVWARADEVERVRIHAPGGDIVLHRVGEGWRIDGSATAPDADSVDGWLTLIAGLVVEARLDASTAAVHGLEPATRWLELSRTGVEGVERVELGTPDTDRMYARRSGETTVLGLDPGTAETLRADAARFRSRHVIRDVPDEMTTLVTDAPGLHDEAANTGGWHLLAPFAADADASTIRLAASRLASLDADRWVAMAPIAAYGLASPRLRITARFEGAPPDADGADAGPPVDASAAARVREYTLVVGASAPDGGLYATVTGQQGVFVLPQSALDDLSQPHIDHALLAFDRARVDRIEITRPRAAGAGSEHLVLDRDGDVWRTATRAPADRARVGTLLDRLADVRAPRVFGYGPPPREAALGAMTLTLHEAAASDAGTARTVRIVFGAGFDGGVYARRDGLDATLSAPRDVSDAVRDFTP